jgi:hypothetical protein
MPLPDSLRVLAHDLAVLDPRRPRQASLRRAVSTGYYALFHLLVSSAVRRMFPTPAEAPFRHAEARRFTHTAIRGLAAEALKPPLQRPKDVNDLLGPAPLIPELSVVCETFLAAHAAREAADYDLSIIHRRSEVVSILNQLDTAFEAWRGALATPEGQRFILALVLLTRQRKTV